MIRLRPLFALLLSLALLWGSVVEAVARSEMAGVTDQVLCGGAVAVTLTVDPNGSPVKPHACLHCLCAGVAAVTVIPVALSAPAQGHRMVDLVRFSAIAVQTPVLMPRARAPPMGP
ncbi:MAG: hypothetical protein ABI832_03400 [bacterium]